MLPRLRRVLARHYGLRVTKVVHLHRGHTNDSHLVRTPRGSYVVRRAWAGRPTERIGREERVLEALAGLSIPRIVPTLDGQRHVLVDGRALHVFSPCAGEVGAAWLLPGDTGRVRTAMTRLAELHRALARIPTPAGCDTWLRERFARVEALKLVDLPRDAREVLRRIEALLERTPQGHLQWLHGDYHLGNLLWDAGDTVASVVDFEDVACGSAVSEAVLALFALARQNQGEERFAWDRSLWDAGLAAYAEASGIDVPTQSAEELEPLFCAYQVLIHLEAAAHRLWALSPGIGFWPCWNRLMRSP